MKDGNKYSSIDWIEQEYKILRMSEVSSRMGNVFRFLSHNYGMTVSEIVELIRSSGYWQCWEYLDQYDLLGRGGAEIAHSLATIANREKMNDDGIVYDKAYWVGWFLTQAMYRGNIGFTDIFETLSGNDIENMYNVYHEMSVTTGIEDLMKRTESPKCFRETSAAS